MHSWLQRTPLRLLAASALLLCSGAAAADDGLGNDEVTLKNGGMLRCTLVSSEPGVAVKLLIAGEKEARVVPWSQVGDVEPNKFAPKPSAVQPGSAGPGYAQPVMPTRVEGPAPALGSPGVVRLHIDSPAPVVVRAHATAYGQVGAYGFVIDAARPVCASPCDKVIDGSLGQDFTVGGSGVTESRRFGLSGMTGDVQLNVSPGSQGLRVGGAWLTILGGTAAISGAVLMVTSVALTTPTFNSNGTETPGKTNGGLLGAGAGVTAVGGAMLIGGIVALVASKTSVEVHSGSGSGELPVTGRAPRYWAGEF